MDRFDSGVFPGGFPYVRAGTGRRSLVVFPGVEDSMFGGRYPPGFERVLYWYFSRHVDSHTVYLVSRPRGLPDGHAIGDMADDYVAIVDDEIGPGDVLGISMGGMIAQALGARHPDLVETLVLANTGYRIGEPAAIDGLLRRACVHDWEGIRAELSRAMFTDWRALAYPPFALTVGRYLLPRPADPTDVRVSLRAIQEFDASGWLSDVDAATLVIGGSEDPYFPEPILRETASLLPDAELDVIHGGKHGAFHEYKATFDARVRAFLERCADALAAEPSRSTAQGAPDGPSNVGSE